MPAFCILVAGCGLCLLLLIGLVARRSSPSRAADPQPSRAPAAPIEWLEHRLEASQIVLRAPSTVQIEELCWTEPAELSFSLPSGYSYRFRSEPEDTAAFSQLRAETIAHVQRWHQDYTAIIDKPDQLLYQAIEAGHHYTAVIACRPLAGRLWMVQTAAMIYDEAGPHTISESECQVLIEILGSLEPI